MKIQMLTRTALVKEIIRLTHPTSSHWIDRDLLVSKTAREMSP